MLWLLTDSIMGLLWKGLCYCGYWQTASCVYYGAAVVVVVDRQHHGFVMERLMLLWLLTDSIMGLLWSCCCCSCWQTASWVCYGKAYVVVVVDRQHHGFIMERLMLLWLLTDSIMGLLWKCLCCCGCWQTASWIYYGSAYVVVVVDRHACMRRRESCAHSRQLWRSRHGRYTPSVSFTSSSW